MKKQLYLTIFVVGIIHVIVAVYLIIFNYDKTLPWLEKSIPFIDPFWSGIVLQLLGALIALFGEFKFLTSK